MAAPAPGVAAHAAEPLNAPRSRSDLFWSFTWLALQGFGGVLAVVQRELVEKKRWMTREQFIEDWAVAQIMPGPNVVNLSMMIGDRQFGLSGALAALAGMLALPTVGVLILAMLFASVADQPLAQGALRGMGAVAAGLIIATGIKLIGALRTSAMGATAARGWRGPPLAPSPCCAGRCCGCWSAWAARAAPGPGFAWGGRRGRQRRHRPARR